MDLGEVPGSGPVDDDEWSQLHATAVAILSELKLRELSAQRWSSAEGVLGSLAEATAAADLAAMTAVIEDLRLLTVIRVKHVDKQPAPREVQERLDVLIASLNARGRGPRAAAGPPGGG
ncbi:CATRA system-associated protein [Streptomyces griseosporeus]|uniref:CATRA system-associated protein n=1 Tax=Streptomyces griseosporeus TaxID=1910 RepID=UPI00378B5B02